MSAAATDEGMTATDNDSVLSMMRQLPVTPEMQAELEAEESPESDQDDLGEAGDGRPVAKEAVGAKGISDEEEDTEGESAPAAKTNSQLINNVARLERENSGLKSRIKDAERERDEVRSRTPDLRSVERIDAVRQVMAHRLGLDPKDPRIKGEMEELISDLMFEYTDEALLKGEELRQYQAAKAERQRTKADRDWRRDLESKVERAEREKRQLQVTQQHQAAMTQVGGILKRDEAKYPFLMDLPESEGNVTQMVAEAAIEAIRSGEFHITTSADEEALVAKIAGNLDRHYRGLAARLAPRLAPPQGAPRGKEVQRVAPKSAAGRPKTATGTGGGGRGRPQWEATDEDTDDTTEGPMDLMSLTRTVSQGIGRELKTRRGR